MSVCPLPSVAVEQRRADGYCVSDDIARIDRERVWRWMAEESYWAPGRGRDVQERAIDNSLCVGLYAPDGTQVGFCRFVTDRATFAWLCDVFVDPAHRGSGAGTFMIEFASAHPTIAPVRLQVLATRDAHELYRKVGYRGFTDDECTRWMVRPLT